MRKPAGAGSVYVAGIFIAKLHLNNVMIHRMLPYPKDEYRAQLIQDG